MLQPSPCTGQPELSNPIWFVAVHQCDAHEPIASHNFSRRIVAVGDLHGDYPNALNVLRMTDVVDSNSDWTGKVDWLVQTGDIIDR
jgi:Calcineurin-like phosphoesterase